LVLRVEELLHHPRAVDLDAVGAVEVTDVPVTVPEGKLGVHARDVGKAHADVTRLAPADGKGLAGQVNRVPPAGRHKFSLRLQTHNRSLLFEQCNMTCRKTTLTHGNEKQ